MGIYVGNAAAWVDNIYQFEETDVVQGGPDGIDNLPLKNLADRTAWLKAQLGMMDRLTGEAVITANTPIDKNFSGKLITAVATGVLTLTLADVTTFKPFTIIPISSFCNPLSVVNILTSAGQKFYNNQGMRSAMYMHDSEHLFLMASPAGNWKIVNAIGNFYTAGEELKGRTILRNTLAFMGQEIQRNIYPRLSEYVLSLTDGQVVSEASWFMNAVTYRGFFTLGNGVSTIRLPDERGMSERMLDAGRGIDLSRYPNVAGGYEKDTIKEHSHDVNLNPNANSATGWGKLTTGSDASEGSIPIVKTSGAKDITTGINIGASETIVKNIGKYSLIKY